MIGTRTTLATLGLAMASLMVSAGAQAAVIRISNADNHEIPLLAGSTVEFDASGNIIAECALDSSDVCAALSSDNNIGAPTVTFARNDGDSDVRAGELVRLTWSSTGANVCSGTATGPSNNWSGAKATSNSAGQSVTVATQGTYTFSLQCFNDAGSSAVQTISVIVGPSDGGGGVGNCTITDPLIAPPSLTRVDKTWVQQWSAPNGSVTATFPLSISAPVPVGAQKNGYTVVPFTPTAGLTIKIFFDPAQPNPLIGYSARPAQAMFISISPCAGDLRPINNSSSDHFERGKCRKFANTGTLLFTTNPSSTLCQLNAGQQYYMTVAPIDTSNGLQTNENSCGNNLTGCDVQAIHRTQ